MDGLPLIIGQEPIGDEYEGYEKCADGIYKKNNGFLITKSTSLSEIFQHTDKNAPENNLESTPLSPDAKQDPCETHPLPDAKVDLGGTPLAPDTKADPVPNLSLANPNLNTFIINNNDAAISAKPRKRLSVLPRVLYDENDLVTNCNILEKKLNVSGYSVDLSLPQIVIVGSKDVGKSNLLECLVGREFLPKGSNASTRRPISVQMCNTLKEEYAIFSHKPGVKFFDFADVMSEIENETRRLPGLNAFSAEPISLEIYSPHVLKLKVVDLPGLIENEENSHTVEEIREMTLSHIRPENTLILAVISATQKTSVVLDIAKEVDPRRKRTIGILTKLDELDDKVDVTDILENRREFLKMGFVGIISRSQKEIESEKDLQFMLDKEEKFFANHKTYRHLKDVMGLPYLLSMVQKIMRRHIALSLPLARMSISQDLAQCQKKLRDFEIKTGDNKQSYIIKLIENFIDDINVQLMGNSKKVDKEKFSYGTLISYELAVTVQKKLLTILPDEKKAEIVIVNTQGIRNQISLSTLAVESLNEIVLEQYNGHMEKSVLCIKEALELAVDQSAVTVLDCYPLLKNEILYQVKERIKEGSEIALNRLHEHINSNMCTINFKHPDFEKSACDSAAPTAGPINLWDKVAAKENVPSVTESAANENAASVTEPDTKAHFKPRSQEEITTELQKSELLKKNVKYATTLLQKIHEPVQKQLEDIAPKYIDYFLITKVLHFIKSDLLSTILGLPNFASIKDDCDVDFLWKKKTEAKVQILKETLDIIQAF